jgi:hypothetical protein
MQSRLVLFVGIVLSGSVLASGCSKLTRSKAAELIKNAGIVQGLDRVQVLVADGCFSIGNKNDYSNRRTLLGDVRNPGISAEIRPFVLRAYDLGLLDVSHEEAEATASTPPIFCRKEWDRERRGFNAYFASEIKVVHWGVTLSKKARDAGISGEGRVALYEKEFIEVTGLTSQQEGTMALAEYQWRWTPTDLGRKLGLFPRGRGMGRAVFRRYDDGWRLIRNPF